MTGRIAAILSTCLLPLCTSASAWQTQVNQDSAVIGDFQKRVIGYVELRKRAESSMARLKSTTSPENIDNREHELARRIREARRDAKQGDIFTPETAMEFRRLLNITMKPGDGTRIRKSLRRAEPVQAPLSVNGHYPSSLPRQSTPPSVLMNLPRVPSEVEYRIVGSSLVLLDGKANLIVDFLPGIFPEA